MYQPLPLQLVHPGQRPAPQHRAQGNQTTQPSDPTAWGRMSGGHKYIVHNAQLSHKGSARLARRFQSTSLVRALRCLSGPAACSSNSRTQRSGKIVPRLITSSIKALPGARCERAWRRSSHRSDTATATAPRRPPPRAADAALLLLLRRLGRGGPQRPQMLADAPLLMGTRSGTSAPAGT